MITTFGDKATARIFQGKFVHSLPLHMQALAHRKLLMNYWETSMVIKRSDLNSIDFSDIDTGDSIPEIHPGEILRSEFLEPLGMSVNALALALRVPAPRINDIVRGKRAISADTALRLERYFGASAQFWLNLQIAYDLRVATAAAGEQIEREIEPMPKANRPKMPKVSAGHARAAALAASLSGSAMLGKARGKA